MRHCTRSLGITLAAGFFALQGCTPQALEEIQGVEGKGLVAKLDNPDALVGILIEDDGRALAYVCDAVEGSSSISAWFEGAVVDDRLEMAAIVGTTYETTSLDAKISAAVQEDVVSGVLTLDDGSEITFTAMTARPETAAGLYVSLDDEALVSAVVSNDNELKGLSRLRNEGWTSRVAPAAPLTRGGNITVNFNNAQAVAVSRTIPVRRGVVEVTPIVVPEPDGPLDSGDGTLMILTEVNRNNEVSGHHYIVQRPDPIGVATIKLTDHLGTARADALQGFMRVQVIDEGGRVLSSQYIDDPLNPFVEIPQSERGGEPYAWIRTEAVRNFLVAVPNLPRARKVVFTRFDRAGRPIRAGGVDLKGKAIPKQQLREQSAATNYDLNAMEYATVQDNGLPEERFDLLILAEGYQDTNADRMAFDAAVSNTLTYLWTIPIYAEYQQKINVHTGFLPSVDSGASTQGGVAPEDKDTVFQSYFDCNAVDDCRLLTLTGEGRLRALEVAQNAPGNYGGGSIDVIMVLLNDDTWAGAGAGKLFTVSAHPDSPQIASHEFGHSAIGLADEYESVYNDLAISQAQQKVNVSGPVSSPNQLKWFDLVHPNTPIPTQVDPGSCIRAPAGDCTASTLPEGTVGMYEGAGYAACGSFRPTTSCIMRCSPTGLFCEVCRKAFRDTLGDPFGAFEAPVEDVYMRDNSLDSGAVPSPASVTDPVTSVYVRPWQSVDINVDAPPFGNLTAENPHENPIAGETNRVHVTVHNRGNLNAQGAILVLWWAPATGGAPPFPQAWTQIGITSVNVPGGGSSTTTVFDWDAPPDAPPHTCMVAGVSSANDPMPQFDVGLTPLVRDNNNVTWRNLHVVTQPIIESEFSNYDRAVSTPTIVRINAASVPVGTEFELTYQTNLQLFSFENDSAGHMPILSAQPGQVQFAKADQSQWGITLRTEMPGGAPSSPFVSSFTLKIALPGGAEGPFLVSVDQLEFEEATGLIGEYIGGNTWFVSFD